jgi:asparagine synthase (glutamine-hydrolysing)
MCGILTILDIDPARANQADLRRQALALGKVLRHRGPDWSGVWANDRAILIHERLSIVSSTAPSRSSIR